MNIELFTRLCYDGDVTLEVTVDDLLKVMKDFAAETASHVLAKTNQEQSPVFFTRKEAMKILKVTQVQTLIDWEERDYLHPYTGGRQICYLQDEVLLLKNFAELLIIKPLKMKINFYDDFF